MSQYRFLGMVFPAAQLFEQASASGPRNGTGGGVLVENSVFDDGDVPGIISIVNSSSVNLSGVRVFEGSVTGISVDGTSSAYLTDVSIIPFSGFCGGGNRNALTLSSGAFVVVTGTILQGCGTDGTGLSATLTGPGQHTSARAVMISATVPVLCRVRSLQVLGVNGALLADIRTNVNDAADLVQERPGIEPSPKALFAPRAPNKRFHGPEILAEAA
jgi:hypothetical protein